jgi:hypothetical protein
MSLNANTKPTPPQAPLRDPVRYPVSGPGAEDYASRTTTRTEGIRGDCGNTLPPVPPIRYGN